MASNSGWTTGLPSGQSKVSDTDDEFRSLKSFQEAWWEQEHYATGGSASSAGIHRLGSGRAYVGTASQLSNPTADNHGRLFFVTDDNVLRVGNVSTSSWSVLADNVTLASDNSWTGANEFTSGISSSQATITGGLAKIGVFSNILAGSLSTDIGSVNGDTFSSLATFMVSGAEVGDVVLIGLEAVDSNHMITGLGGYVVSADVVGFTFYNAGVGAINPSDQTYTALVFKRA